MNEGKMTKLCIDCKWYKKNYYVDECLCPEFKQKQNPVTGNPIRKFCQLERLEGEKCGLDAKYWMEKQPPEKFWNKLFNFGEK